MTALAVVEYCFISHGTGKTNCVLAVGRMRCLPGQTRRWVNVETRQQAPGCVVSLLDQSIEDFSTCLQDFELDFRQLDSGSFRARTISVDLGGIQLKRRTTSVRYALRGRLPPSLIFYFPLKPCRIFANGYHISPDVQLVSVGGVDLFSIVQDRYDHLLVCLGEGEIRQHLDPGQTLQFMQQARRIDLCKVNVQRKISLTRQLFELYCNILYRSPRPDPDECRRYRGQIIRLLYDYLCAHENLQRQSPGSQERLLQRALLLVESRPEHVFSLDELSHEVYASKRAVQYAFNDLAGLSPMRYIKLNRLNRIRKELLQGTELSIGNLVGKYHFSNQGRLVREYTELFGERPRDTAQLAPRPALSGPSLRRSTPKVYAN